MTRSLWLAVSQYDFTTQDQVLLPAPVTLSTIVAMVTLLPYVVQQV